MTLISTPFFYPFIIIVNKQYIPLTDFNKGRRFTIRRVFVFIKHNRVNQRILDLFLLIERECFYSGPTYISFGSDDGEGGI